MKVFQNKIHTADFQHIEKITNRESFPKQNQNKFGTIILFHIKHSRFIVNILKTTKQNTLFFII